MPLLRRDDSMRGKINQQSTRNILIIAPQKVAVMFMYIEECLSLTQKLVYYQRQFWRKPIIKFLTISIIIYKRKCKARQGKAEKGFSLIV